MKIKITHQQEEERQMRRESVAIFDALTYDQLQLVNGRKETA